jgi:hypothetical protein
MDPPVSTLFLPPHRYLTRRWQRGQRTRSPYRALEYLFVEGGDRSGPMLTRMEGGFHMEATQWDPVHTETAPGPITPLVHF